MTRYLVRTLFINTLEALRPLAANDILALVDGRPAGLLPCFARAREAWCTPLAVHTEFQRMRVIPRWFDGRVHAVTDGAHTTSAPGDGARRGATGDERIVSEVVSRPAVPA